MSGIIISRSAKSKIERIFEHPDEVYSIYRRNGGEVEWVRGKKELYAKVREIEKE